MKIKDIVKIIDHANIKSTATANDIRKTCQEARKCDFRGVCVNPEWTRLVARELRGTGIKTVVLIDPPIGDSPHRKRVTLAKEAKREGADEIDVVINVPAIKHEKWNEVLKDLKGISKILPTKVIIGSGYLTDEEIREASKIAKKAGAFCVKTATSKDPLENRETKEKAYHLKLMRESAPGLMVKASGNIKTLKDIKEMVKAGADIIGTSHSAEMIKNSKSNL